VTVIQDLLGLEGETHRYCRDCKKDVSLDLWDSYDIHGPHARYQCRPCKQRHRKQLSIAKANNPCNQDHCDICKIVPSDFDSGSNGGVSRVGKMKSILICDHDHETGEFRGWVCDDCNNMLSRAKDNIDTLREGANYLEKFQE
jgi:hypothetical protein